MYAPYSLPDWKTMLNNLKLQLLLLSIIAMYALPRTGPLSSL